MDYRYGHFNEDGSEFLITNPATPRAFDNFAWNEAIYANIQQTGVGCLDYQVGEGEAVQLFTGTGRICDFDVFGRDHLMSRLIYVRDNDTGEFWNLNWEPVRRPYERFECAHGLGYSVISTSVNGVGATWRIFVPPGQDPVELWSLVLRAEDGRPRNLSLFIYNQLQLRFKAGFDSYGDMIYRGAWFNKAHNAVVAAKHPFIKPHDFLTVFLTADRPIAAYDGSREAFVGLYSQLSAPDAVVNGRCTNTPGCSDATIAAAQFDLRLEPGQPASFELMIGATDSEAGIGVLREKYLGHIGEHFEALRREKTQLWEHNAVNTPDPQFDRLVNGWIKQANLFGASWCRWGYNGFRDIVQHALGIAAFKPERTREILLQAMRYQYASGLALRGWNPIDEKAYSDSALWLVYALTTYLKETGDYSLLEVEVPFYDEGSAKVLDHAERALEFLENNRGAHGLCLIKFGDWNDSLTGVGKAGRGESVWLSQAYAEGAREMAGLMAKLGRKDRMDTLLARRERMLAAINAEAWDGAWYARCFDDSGRALGSAERRFARVFMETQSWALISGAASEERAEELIASCDELLGTEAGYLLLSPAFTEFDESIGRISSLEPGVCENGTVYSHLNIWMILGLLRYGLADKAYEVFRKISPGYVSGPTDQKQNCPPYMYANCYYGPAHRNNAFQMEFTWITGSVAWFNTVLTSEMLGVRPDYDGLVIEPHLPSAWEQCSLTRTFRGAVYEIAIHNPERLQSGEVNLTLDGRELPGNTLPLPVPGQRHRVEVYVTRRVSAARSAEIRPLAPKEKEVAAA